MILVYVLGAVLLVCLLVALWLERKKSYGFCSRCGSRKRMDDLEVIAGAGDGFMNMPRGSLVVCVNLECNSDKGAV